MGFGQLQMLIQGQDRLSMKIVVGGIQSEISSLFNKEEGQNEYNILSSVKANVAISYGVRVLDLHDVSVLRFYLDIKDSFSEVIVRGVRSSIMEQFEGICDLWPNDGGYMISDPQPPYPIDISNQVREFVSLEMARSIIAYLEIIIRSLCSPHRPEILSVFDRTNSPALFDILRAIDGASAVPSN